MPGKNESEEIRTGDADKGDFKGNSQNEGSAAAGEPVAASPGRVRLSRHDVW